MKYSQNFDLFHSTEINLTIFLIVFKKPRNITFICKSNDYYYFLLLQLRKQAPN